MIQTCTNACYADAGRGHQAIDIVYRKIRVHGEMSICSLEDQCLTNRTVARQQQGQKSGVMAVATDIQLAKDAVRADPVRCAAANGRHSGAKADLDSVLKCDRM